MGEERIKQIRLAKKRFYEVQSDLISSKSHNFENNLKIFVDFCESNPIMKQITEPLKNDQSTDLKKWWDDIQKTGGSMVGSKRYFLPSDLEKQASLLHKFLLGINSGEFNILGFVISVYGHRGISDNIYEFNHDITVRLIRYFNDKLDELETEAVSAISATRVEAKMDKRNVFVVYGRNSKARDAMFDFLRSLDLNPLEWSQAVSATKKASPYIGEVLDQAFSMAQAVVVLMTPDDEARLRETFWASADPDYEKELTGQARPNVLFEAGIAMGRNQDRTVLVELGNLRPFSDIAGRHSIRINNSPEKRNELANRLEDAGCLIKRTGNDWLRKGEFDNALD